MPVLLKYGTRSPGRATITDVEIGSIGPDELVKPNVTLKLPSVVPPVIATGTVAAPPAGRLRVPDDGLTVKPDGALAVHCTVCGMPVTDCRASVVVPDLPG